MADANEFPWLRYSTPANAVHRCPECRTSPVHLEELAAAEADYERMMDPARYNGRPPAELRDRRTALQQARDRRLICPGFPHPLPEAEPLPEETGLAELGVGTTEDQLLGGGGDLSQVVDPTGVAADPAGALLLPQLPEDGVHPVAPGDQAQQDGVAESAPA